MFKENAKNYTLICCKKPELHRVKIVYKVTFARNCVYVCTIKVIDFVVSSKNVPLKILSKNQVSIDNQVLFDLIHVPCASYNSVKIFLGRNIYPRTSVPDTMKFLID